MSGATLRVFKLSELSDANKMGTYNSLLLGFNLV
jgi:hypothetical protein